MPTQDIAKVRLYAHCRNALCAGYAQQEIEGVRIRTDYAYRDNGGDIPGVERSCVDLLWGDPEDREGNTAKMACPFCQQRRELSETVRPSYQPMSGHDPMGLVNGGVKAYNASAPPNTERDAEVAELRAQVARQEALLLRLTSALGVGDEGGD